MRAAGPRGALAGIAVLALFGRLWAVAGQRPGGRDLAGAAAILAGAARIP